MKEYAVGDFVEYSYAKESYRARIVEITKEGCVLDVCVNKRKTLETEQMNAHWDQIRKIA